jgi:hypothetical protein
MTYRDNVEQAATALKRGEDANWELARLTFESTFTPGNVSLQPERRSMVDWCTDVRAASGRPFSHGTGTRYKAIWRKYGALPLSGRPEWLSASDEYSGHVDEPITERLAKQHGEVLIRHGSADVKREAFQQLASDPDVIDEAAVLGTPTSRAVSELYTKTERVRAEHRERAIEADPISKELDEIGAAIDLEAACNRFARDLETMSERFVREINEALPRAGEGREQHLYWIRQAIARSRAVLDELEGYAETGRSDLDTFLSDVLGGR